MVIKDLLTRHVSKSPEDWVVRFWEQVDDGDSYPMFATTVNIVNLYKDWYKDCDYCPENDTLIYGIEFSNDKTGQTWLPEVDLPGKFHFEDLMRCLEDCLGWNGTIEKQARDIIRDTAEEIVEILSNCGFDNCTDSSGHYVIRKFDDGSERMVEVYKSTCDGTEEPHYAIYVRYEDEAFDWQFTKDLSVEALEKELREATED